MITVYTGDGKGKTTSAIGEGLVRLGSGQKVLMVQFLKGSTYSGELTGLYRLGIPYVQFGVGCRWSGMIRTGLRHCTGCGECFRQNRDPAIATGLVQEALSLLRGSWSEEYDVIILDEISHVLTRGLLVLSELQEILDKPLDWILTGRRMPGELLPLADYWWDLEVRKHPFAQGVKSRRGIEY
ncbi:MAG: cob(I)yrinic acid a,c-diamide adenosyltransferase [Desulfitobacteriaceae bacterium]